MGRVYLCWNQRMTPETGCNQTNVINAVPSASTPPRRRRLRGVSVRALMLVVLVVAGGLGWIAHRASMQQQSVAAIKAAGGRVYYDWEWDPGTHWFKPGSPSPGWLRRQLGPGFSEEVVSVTIPDADDSLMVHIGRLRHLQEIWIAGGNVTDTGLAPIGGQTNLRMLYIADTIRITDAGLAHLTGLKRCRRIHFIGTKVTRAGIAALKSKCPWMTIVR
jgi:hypothetical protein